MNILKKLYWILQTQFGIDPILFFKGLKNTPRFFLDFIKFKKSFNGTMKFLPCLHDKGVEGGIVRGEYFLQDLFIAQRIFTAKPKRHIDIGSRTDGFVAHVASFRKIDVIDIRPLTNNIENISFFQANIMAEISKKFYKSTDSLSCLHALEHFGLGRYGDPVNPEGFKLGIKNMASMLKSNGILYLSTPIGIPRVEFNGHRIFDPIEIINNANFNKLQLEEFSIIDNRDKVIFSKNLDIDLEFFKKSNYVLGIFIFRKKSYDIIQSKKLKQA